MFGPTRLHGPIWGFRCNRCPPFAQSALAADIFSGFPPLIRNDLSFFSFRFTLIIDTFPSDPDCQWSILSFLFPPVALDLSLARIRFCICFFAARLTPPLTFCWPEQTTGLWSHSIVPMQRQFHILPLRSVPLLMHSKIYVLGPWSCLPTHFYLVLHSARTMIQTQMAFSMENKLCSRLH